MSPATAEFQWTDINGRPHRVRNDRHTYVHEYVREDDVEIWDHCDDTEELCEMILKLVREKGESPSGLYRDGYIGEYGRLREETPEWFCDDDDDDDTKEETR